MVFATQVEVDVRDDIEILRWARQHCRIMVCHDGFSDRETHIRMSQELYKHGGKVITIRGGPGQHPLTSLGKLLVHRYQWLEWFQENKHGLVSLTGTKWTGRGRDYMQKQFQNVLEGTPLPPIGRRRTSATTPPRRARNIPIEQMPLTEEPQR